MTHAPNKLLYINNFFKKHLAREEIRKDQSPNNRPHPKAQNTQRGAKEENHEIYDLSPSRTKQV
jgi:hypothetical protein